MRDFTNQTCDQPKRSMIVTCDILNKTLDHFAPITTTLS